MSQPAAEEPSGHSHERPRRRAAFGLTLDIQIPIQIPGLGPAQASAAAQTQSQAQTPTQTQTQGQTQTPTQTQTQTQGQTQTPTQTQTQGQTQTPTQTQTQGQTQTPTRIALDPAEVARRSAQARAGWRRLGALGASDRPYLTVDFAERAGYLLWAEGFGRVLISADGRELLCDPAPGRADWTTILWAQALPFAATLRGLEVLHAAGVVTGAGAVLLAGEPGAGKSSLAAALVRRGAGLLGDDALAVAQRAGQLVAHPSVGLLHLRPAEDARLSAVERAALGTPTELPGRRRYTRAVARAAPLAALLLVERSAQEPVLEPLDAVDPFDLLASTFNLSIRTPERLRRQLDLVAALADGGHVYRLRVQPGMDATRLAALVDEQLRAPAR